jgi:hypothetical protein
VAAHALAVPDLPQAEPAAVAGLVTSRAAGFHVGFPDILIILEGVMAAGAVQAFRMPIMVEGHARALLRHEGRIPQKDGFGVTVQGHGGETADDGQESEAADSGPSASDKRPVCLGSRG